MPRARKPRTANEDKIAETALRLAGQRGWADLTLDAIAKAANIPPASLRGAFADTNAILPAISRHIDRQMERGFDADGDASPRDRLFEILMARFDVLQKHRAGITAIFGDIRRHPDMARQLLPAQWNSMRKILRLAEADGERGKFQPLFAAGLLGMYALAFCVWQRDSSPEMDKTMASLDRLLRLAEYPARALTTVN